MEENHASARVSKSGDIKMLSIDSINDPVIQGYRIYYDPVTYRISKILIGMLRLSPLDEEQANIVEDNNNDTETKPSAEKEDNDNEDEITIDTYTYYLEINYAEITPLDLRQESFHPENKFIRIAKDRIELTPAYSNYQLLDNTEQPNETANRSEEN